MTTILAHLSAEFAKELLALTNAIEAGDDVEHRMKVMHEYAKTWMLVADEVHHRVHFMT